MASDEVSIVSLAISIYPLRRLVIPGIFFLIKVRHVSWSRLGEVNQRSSCPSIVLPNMRTSSMKRSKPFRPWSVSAILRWKYSGPEMIPKGSHWNQYLYWSDEYDYLTWFRVKFNLPKTWSCFQIWEIFGIADLSQKIYNQLMEVSDAPYKLWHLAWWDSHISKRCVVCLKAGL